MDVGGLEGGGKKNACYHPTFKGFFRIMTTTTARGGKNGFFIRGDQKKKERYSLRKEGRKHRSNTE